jgi:hypothetical protein
MVCPLVRSSFHFVCHPNIYLQMTPQPPPPLHPHPFHGGVRIGWGFIPFLSLPITLLYWVIPGLRPHSILSVTQISIYRWHHNPPPHTHFTVGWELGEASYIPFSTLNVLYCTATKTPLMYSFSGNSAASAPISTFICLWAIFIVPGSVYTLHISPSRIGRPNMGIYKSLTDTWLWKSGLRSRYSFSGNICFKILVFCLCSVGDPWVEVSFHFVYHPNIYLQMTPQPSPSPLTHFTAG